MLTRKPCLLHAGEHTVEECALRAQLEERDAEIARLRERAAWLSKERESLIWSIPDDD